MTSYTRTIKDVPNAALCRHCGKDEFKHHEGGSVLYCTEINDSSNTDFFEPEVTQLCGDCDGWFSSFEAWTAHLVDGLCPAYRKRRQSTNPKDKIGRTKVPMHLVPSVAIAHCALAMEDGANKYGPYNWRENDVAATVYISAAERHLRSWLEGEEKAADSGRHHLAHAMACLAILLDAQEGGNLVDDRPKAGPLPYVLQREIKAVV